MQDDGVDIRTVRPHDGSQLFVYLNTSEEVWIVQKGLKDRTAQKFLHVDLSPGAIVERQKQPEPFQGFD